MWLLVLLFSFLDQFLVFKCWRAWSPSQTYTHYLNPSEMSFPACLGTKTNFTVLDKGFIFTVGLGQSKAFYNGKIPSWSPALKSSLWHHRAPEISESGHQENSSECKRGLKRPWLSSSVFQIHLLTQLRNWQFRVRKCNSSRIVTERNSLLITCMDLNWFYLCL